MKAGVLYKKKDIKCDEYPEPSIKEGTVKINVKACGICKSDVPRVLNGTAHFYPIVLGHEFSGIVTEIADDVENVKVGDHVAGIPLIPCFKCKDCEAGNYSLCKNYSFIGSREQGAYADYVVVPKDNVLKIADEVSFEQGALFEPATVALHAFYLTKFNPEKAKNVAILGFGTIGLFATQWAKILGAEKVTVFIRNNDMIEKAKKYGADYVINTKDEDFIEKAKELTNGGYDYIFETAGNSETIKHSFKLASNKADICMVGTPTNDVVFTWQEWELVNRKEFNLTGSWMSYSKPWPGIEWKKTAECFKNGLLKYDKDIFHKIFELEEIDKAFECYEKEKVNGRILIKNK